MSFFTARVLLWPVLTTIALVVAGAVAIVAVFGINGVTLGSLFTNESSDRDSQVIQSVTRQQEVALLSLHIEGIARQESNGEIFGVPVPASERVTLIQYRFDAKLGIDGSRVEIRSAGPESFLVTIPEFIGIGFDDPVFEDPIESNNALSWLAPPAVETRIVNNILSDENKQRYIAENQDALEEQARVFYSGIIASVDPEVSLEFEFAG